MEEMLEDTLDMEEDEELEEEADAEVDKVLFELTNGKLGEAGSVDKELPVSAVNILTLEVCSSSCSHYKVSLRTNKIIEIWKNTASS